MYKLKLFFLVIFTVAISGCNYITGGSDNSIPPMALTDIKPSKELKKVWQAKVGEGASGSYLKLSPLLLNNKIITVDAKGHMQARELKSGKVLWQSNVEHNITQGVAGNESKLFISSADGALLAYSTKDGKELWQRKLKKSILNNPVISGNELYLQTADGTLYAFEATNGKLRWEYKLLTPDLTLYTTSSPVIWRDNIIAGYASGRIVAFDRKSGMPIWERQIAEPRGSSIIKKMVDITAKPFIYNGILYTVSFQGNMQAINLTNGQVEWTKELSAINDINTNGKHLFVSDTDGYVWALNRYNGRVLWKQKNMSMRDLSGVAYSDNTILVGDYEGYLHGLSPEDGDFVARTKLAKSGIRVAPQVKDGIIYILDNSGNLAAYSIGSLA